MYRVMIVDDEEPVLESFSFMIEKHIDGFVLCAKARSGTEAIELVAETKPDVVFMDIHMPGIDGIDTIIEIRKQHPEIVFILATAYERFDIAQRAIPLNVFSYLVKPITRNMLMSEFEKIQDFLDEIRQRNSSHIEDVQNLYKTKEAVKERFLASIIWENPTQKEWEEFKAAASVSCDGGAVYLFDIEGQEGEEHKMHVYEQIDDKIKRRYASFCYFFSGRMLQFFPSSQDLQKLENFCRSLVSEFQKTPLKLGIGGLVTFDGIHGSYRGALEQIRMNPDEASSFLSEKVRMEKICNDIFGADFKEGERSLEKYWTNVFHRDSFLIAKSKMVALFTLIFSRVDREILEAAECEMNPPIDIIQLASIKEWNAWVKEALALIESVLAKYKDNAYPPHLIKAISIIHQNYGQPIKLSGLAEECNITASYLSRLFSEYMNMSFVDYLNKYRVEQALVLLKDKRLSVKETSRLVGYQDPNYFSRIFRRYMNMSPTDIFSRRL